MSWDNTFEPHLWSPEELESVASCLSCGAEKSEELHAQLVDSVFHTAGEWTLRRCTECDCAFLSPRPRPEFLSHAYASYYTHKSKAEKPQSSYSSLMLGSKNAYTNARWGTALQPASSALGFVQYFIPGRPSMLNWAIRTLPRGAPGRKFLDVGCGSGDFLSIARSAGWETFGVDFDGNAVAQARQLGHQVVEGSIDALDGHDKFDAITVSHVIEHVPDPFHLLQRCYALLKPGGYFWLETPNLGSKGSMKYGRHWRGLEPPRHLVLFNRPALIRLHERAGFAEIHDAPWAPRQEVLFPISDAIRRGAKDPGNAVPTRFQRYQMRLLDWLEGREKNNREYITLIATKLGPNK
jgi:2-polyprenyl-3-methyl-5-hydroxy-6-metoxy-1,4-benzoquinol methylase